MNKPSKRPGSRAITIPLDRERKLAFDMNAMCYLDEHCGINALEGIDFSQFDTPRRMRSLLTACLQTDAMDHGEELTEQQVGALFSLGQLVEFTSSLDRLVEESLPGKKERTADPVPPEAREGSPGQSSGPSRASTSDSPTTSSGA
ncbi:hypothetical protein [Vulgatibacter sp.]|uniref:hypothetical protein n=1 Tax=Vulgatibacter sp. TaxID=1971226 RepID=UPI0035687F08